MTIEPDLPDMIFVGIDGAHHVFSPTKSAASIRALSDDLARRRPAGEPVGLLFKTGAALVTAWLASVHAGLEPLILQYPTKKQSGPYWRASIEHTLALTRIGLVLAESAALADGLDAELVVVATPETAAASAMEAEALGLPDTFAILQLSSGTTGHRKAIRFTSAALRRHVADFNQRLGLGEDDIIASWLPLYHDMGYVACFVMPLLLGVRTVTIDPMDWVARPALLFDAIERTNATTCYMPNFGFEVMTRAGKRRLPSMRRWISCSEPVAPSTVRRFAAALEAPSETMFACYAMAENVFAVTYGEARIVTCDGVEHVACGPPIDGVDLRFDGDDIRVRSPTALAAYVGGDGIQDEDGFYPTGDLGRLVDGALVVHGRTSDLLLQAGRKILLGDVDLAVNRLLPDARGRAAAIARPDASLGTETALVLVEANGFHARDDAGALARALREETALTALSVAFVPPLFLTKTSSGKMNRREIAAHWKGVETARGMPAEPADDTRGARLRRLFPSLKADMPVGEVLDSLSLTVLAIELADAAVALDPTRSLDEMVARVSTPEPRDDGHRENDGTIRIVSLADLFTLPSPDAARLNAFAEAIGAPVTFEHLCLPPTPIVLSDLVFSRWFAPRIADGAMQAVRTALDRLRGASVIITDDMAELHYLYESTYPVLSHRLVRDPSADLISVRWQGYVREHHRLPVTAVAGIDIPLGASAPSVAALSSMLGVPIFRMASVPGFAPWTEAWEYRAFGRREARLDGFWTALADWARARATPLARVPRRAGPDVMASDLPHFCASAVNPAAIEAIVGRYASFALCGQPASVPRLERAIAAAGKACVRLPSYAPAMLADVDAECVIACGAFGPVPEDRPFLALQHVGQPWRTRNLGGLSAELPPLGQVVESGTDWYREFTLDRLRDYAAWRQARGEQHVA